MPLNLVLGGTDAEDARAWVTNDEFEYEEIDTDILDDGSAVSVLLPARSFVSVLTTPALEGWTMLCCLIRR